MIYWPSTFSDSKNISIKWCPSQIAHTLGGLQAAIHNDARHGYIVLLGHLARPSFCVTQAETHLEKQALLSLPALRTLDLWAAIFES